MTPVYDNLPIYKKYQPNFEKYAICVESLCDKLPICERSTCIVLKNTQYMLHQCTISCLFRRNISPVLRNTQYLLHQCTISCLFMRTISLVLEKLRVVSVYDSKLRNIRDDAFD